MYFKVPHFEDIETCICLYKDLQQNFSFMLQVLPLETVLEGLEFHWQKATTPLILFPSLCMPLGNRKQSIHKFPKITMRVWTDPQHPGSSAEPIPTYKCFNAESWESVSCFISLLFGFISLDLHKLLTQFLLVPLTLQP